MSFFNQPQAPRAEHGHEQPVKKPPQEAVPNTQKWDQRTERPNALLLRARQLQDQLERLHGSMAAIDGSKDADEAFGDDMRAVEALIVSLTAEPDNKEFRAMLQEIWDRRMPKKRN